MPGTAAPTFGRPQTDAVEDVNPKSVPPALDVSEGDWLAPDGALAPDAMFAGEEQEDQVRAEDPFSARRARVGHDDHSGFEEPTVRMSALQDLELGDIELGAYDDPNDDDDAFDGAKTQKLARPDFAALRGLPDFSAPASDRGNDDALDDEPTVVAVSPREAPRTDAPHRPGPTLEASPSGSDPDDADEGPAETPGLAAASKLTASEAAEEKKRDSKAPRARKSRRGRKRRAVKIPDDATPLPPPVALGELAAESLTPPAASGKTSPAVDAPAVETDSEGAGEREQASAAGSTRMSSPPPPTRARLETLTGNGPPSQPEPFISDEEVTLMRPVPAELRANAGREAAERSQRVSAEEARDDDDDEAVPLGDDLGKTKPVDDENQPRRRDETSPDPDEANANRARADVSSRREDGEPTSPTPSPGVVADQTSIGLVRPIQVVSDLPAVEELKRRTVEAAEMGRAAVAPPSRPPPPQTPPPASAEAGGGGGGAVVSQRRPPPPRRGTEPSMTAEAGGVADEAPRELPPPRSLESPPPPPAGPTAAEANLALAEARARNAAEKARRAAAKAAEAEAKAKAAQASPPKKPWWAEMFTGDLVRTLDNPRKLDVERETTFIAECLRQAKGARILDLACGNGVHAVELSSRGYQVVGVDYSDKMLDLARAYNNQRGTSVSFIQGDMRKLNLEGVFDGIYCWSSSFGYFDENTNANVLERIARAVRPGGTFALDVDNRDFVAPRAPQMAWFEKPGVVCMDEMRFDYYASRMMMRRMAIFEDQAPREIETNIRLYTLREIGRLLQRVGFRILEVSGHRSTRGAYFGDVSPRIIICCQRREEE
ncbi:MAG: methyltransferase domain-containing protein [Myxococcota bacterium]